MLDKLWPVLRDGLMLLIPAVASVLLPWATGELVPALGAIDPRYATIATAVISMLALVLTPLTKKYGVVADKTAGGNVAVTGDRGSDPLA